MSSLFPILAALLSTAAPSHRSAPISSLMTGQTGEHSHVKVQPKSKHTIYRIGRVRLDGAAFELVQESWNEVSEALPPERIPELFDVALLPIR